MKFGSVDNPALVDFTLPADHPGTERVLTSKGGAGLSEIYVGCAKWNKGDLKKFYPKGVKDELAYYAQQFNSVELNATFYNNYGPEQIEKWNEKVPDGFKFFPKVSRYISHIKRLNAVGVYVNDFCQNISTFGPHLGMAFLQVHDNFSPKNKDRISEFMDVWSWDIPLAVELRNTDWFNDEEASEWIYDLFEKYEVSNIVTDTAGRRDLLHMRLTSPVAFVRYVGANHESDYQRLDDWIARIKIWKAQGLEKLYFFVHQNLEKASPFLSAYFLEQFNKEFGTDLPLPELGEQAQGNLF
ncbi:DUF72 domain-containing protein [Marinoscillum sp. 108]|uniref:DUF72 domain-containing protein n=1 Tax=Marinoscillum sp. 108 TaxID=2653151 RepID=UPI0012F24E91|nr:DUF72 domain-containing protein [Marinoscillum sp. 108]VXD19858.1 DUF72 domain-containing protein [Marinoscillum sp. 108]